MSSLYSKRLSLTGASGANLPEWDLRSMVRKRLASGIHGISFSPYTEGQGPGTIVSTAQIRERLEIIQPYVKWIRTFSCTEGNELIPEVARSMGLKTMVGVWLGDDKEKNEIELENAIQLANDGLVDVLGVGNEVLLRGDLTEAELLDMIHRAKAGVQGKVPVGYVDAYFEFEDHPGIADACDVILANCYPFWEGCPAPFALLYMKDMYRRAQRAGGGKPVIITETGWPNIGTAEGAAEPSPQNAMAYFIDTYDWAAEDEVEVFYFSSFDEAWKVEAEGDVGAYWGLWDKDGVLKYV